MVHCNKERKKTVSINILKISVYYYSVTVFFLMFSPIKNLTPFLKALKPFHDVTFLGKVFQSLAAAVKITHIITVMLKDVTI